MPPDVEEIYDSLDNKSAFLRMALKQAAGIITWALMQQQDPEKYALDETPTAEEIAAFNKVFPADKLTQAKREKSSQTLANKPDLW